MVKLLNECLNAYYGLPGLLNWIQSGLPLQYLIHLIVSMCKFVLDEAKKRLYWVLTKIGT